MKDSCIFCQKELSMLQRKKLFCGNTSQILCGDCYAKYKNLNSAERAEAALKTGRAEDEQSLKDYLAPIKQAEKEKTEQNRAKKEKMLSGKECLRCGTEMLDYGSVTFKLGEETFFFSDMNRLASGSLTMNVLRCDNCGKAEFYIPDADELESAAQRQNK